MKDEGGRMKGMLFNIEGFKFKSTLFILHPSAFILALHLLAFKSCGFVFNIGALLKTLFEAGGG